MALNPFFLQGSSSEQRLVQELINEQLRIYGVEIIYIPRKFVKKETILKEISSSKFDDNYSIEAYISNYDGYTGQGDILSKFGVNLKDEVTLIISRERFEDFIVPLLNDEGDDNIEHLPRPKEGDLVYFPLGKRLFEIKFVEQEQPFYQLNKLYVYELRCELFEYEDEVINTTVEEVDTKVQNEGYITTLNLIGIGKTATATSVIGSGYIRKVYLNDDGYAYSSTPTVSIAPAPLGGINATAVAITTSYKGSSLFSVKEIILTNSGFGYTSIPKITISGGGGTGAAATCSIEKTENGVIGFNIIDGGEGYKTKPLITISGPGIGETAVGIASLGQNSEIVSISISNPGVGYTQPPTVLIEPPSIISGSGNYALNEIVVGSVSNTKARVKDWDEKTKILKVSNVGIGETVFGFYSGEVVIGTASSARYAISSVEQYNLYDKYSQNKDLQKEANQILDFSESNPFGNY